MTDPPSLSTLRHELRTPVNHIIGYAEMLLEDADGAEQLSAQLSQTIEAARRALSLINEALPPTQTTITSDELDRLRTSLLEPRQHIIDAIRALLDTDAAKSDAELVQDAEKILQAASRLTEFPDTATPVPVAPAAVSAAPDIPEPEREPLRGRALVVDDIRENREVLERRLRREGCTVTCVANGREALDRVRQEEFDIVLLDILMPELDGFDTLTALKSDPATRDLPVIMISALDDFDSVVRCIEHGADEYLPKPFNPVILRARVGACLQKKRMRDVEREYLRQVNHVIAAANAVETGTYEPGALSRIGERADELGRLARVFDAMAGRVRDREARLKHQVAELKSEIAVARRETAEIEIPDEELATGSRFADRYEILGTIGTGGMGKVYHARDDELGEELAIKTLRPEFVADPILLERFKSETRLARKITHRNVVRTYDFGDWNGVYYLTMEYVEGLTVRDLLAQRGRLTLSSTLAVSRQLVDSLAVAHEAGVIHRDIKPQNLLLDDSGCLKVMDFGVARLAERTSDLTEAGLVLGTPTYMPPEQMLGENVDLRCDLYAVGVVMYECLTGKVPFEASSPVSLVAKVLSNEPKPPAQVNDEIPPIIDKLIMRLLSKDPDRRPGTAELREVLAQLG